MTAQPLEDRTYPTPCGERRTYLRGCRCADCSRANIRYVKANRLLRQRGVDAYVPFDRFAAAIRPWLDAGYSPGAVSKAAGLSDMTVKRTLDAGRPVLASTYRAVLAAPEPSGKVLVPGDLTRKRIRSLQRAGWSFPAMEEHLGFRIASGPWRESPTVAGWFAEAIRGLYRKLECEPGPSRQVASQARGNGYPLPAEWDDPGTLAWPAGHTAPVEGEEVGEEPVDEVAVRRFLHGDRTVQLTREERMLAIRLAPDLNVSSAWLITAWHLSGTTFARLRADAERPPTPAGG